MFCSPSVTQIYPPIWLAATCQNEAGCYHSNSLVAVARGIGQRVALEVCRYDISEPQYSKDVCDRILCPMKTCIRRFCNERHDILLTGDMRRTLSVVGMNVSMEPWQTNDRAFRVNLLKSNVHRL